ncbi:MAG: hypothetical protein E7513_07140 [Ruminococcaceae bacterium]|nr:hypothetical protein [Oscillospiraceae bacterium]
MRKISVSLLAISFFVFSLFGCDIGQRKAPVVFFESDAVLHSENLTIESKVISAQGKNITLSILSPKDVKGLTYSLSNSNLHINFGNLKCTTSTDYLPSFSAVDVLFDTLSAMQSSSFDYKATKEYTDIYKGTCEGGSFLMYVDSVTGNITRIEPSYTDCYITFNNIDT